MTNTNKPTPKCEWMVGDYLTLLKGYKPKIQKVDKNLTQIIIGNANIVDGYVESYHYDTITEYTGLFKTNECKRIAGYKYYAVLANDRKKVLASWNDRFGRVYLCLDKIRKQFLKGFQIIFNDEVIYTERLVSIDKNHKYFKNNQCFEYEYDKQFKMESIITTDYTLFYICKIPHKERYYDDFWRYLNIEVREKCQEIMKEG